MHAIFLNTSIKQAIKKIYRLLRNKIHKIIYIKNIVESLWRKFVLAFTVYLFKKTAGLTWYQTLHIWSPPCCRCVQDWPVATLTWLRCQQGQQYMKLHTVMSLCSEVTSLRQITVTGRRVSFTVFQSIWYSVHIHTCQKLPFN